MQRFAQCSVNEMRIFAQKMFCFWYFVCGRQVQCNIIYNDLKFRCFSIFPLLWWCCPAVCLVSVSPISESLLLCLEKRWAQLSVTSSCDLWIIFVINIGIVIMKWLAQYLVSEPSSLWSRLIFSAYTGPAPGPRPGLAQHKPVSVRRSFQSAPSSPLLCWQLSVSGNQEPGQRSPAQFVAAFGVQVWHERLYKVVN